MSDYDERYVSDNESDFGDYDDDDVVGKAEDVNDDDVLITPADQDEGFDEDTASEYYESDVEELEDDDAPPADPDFEEEDDSLDLKKVSNYNKEIIVVHPDNRRTSHILSKYEMTEIVSIRATQISQHNNCMVDITGLDDPIKMAKRELMMRKSPLVLRRIVGDRRDENGEIRTYCEFWSPSEMQFATTYHDVL